MMQEGERAIRKVRKGIVVANKMNNTVIVRVTRACTHAKYGKIGTRMTKCYAHDDSGLLKLGDEVLVMETRPLSKLKRWRVVEKIQSPSEAS
jgi:small subunit ribosomal protein S17